MTQMRNTICRTVPALWVACAYAAVLCLTLTVAPSARAQVLYGTLTGTVSDASNAAVPNAPVTALNQGTGATRTTTASANGEYTIPDLPPGIYSVVVDPVGGFSKFTQKNVVISVTQDSPVPILLHLSSLSPEVPSDPAPPCLQPHI